MPEPSQYMVNMPSTVPEGAQAPSSRFAWDGLGRGQTLILFALGACWLLFFNELRDEWQVNPQYSYGYLVPLLGGALLWRRWPDRPAASPRKISALLGVVVGLLLLQLPLNIFLEANPEWRLLYWINGFQVMALTGCLLYRWGGGPWIRHFALPLGFMLIAVPWPMQWEQTIIQGLMRFVAGLTVDVAGVLGIPAIQHGNLIEVGTGTVGIDEACSGVRSLQSALMLSLFLGEMHRFSWLRRAGLIGSSLVFVLLANLTRTSFLVWIAARRGLDEMAAWHDTAGMVIMFIVLPSLMVLAYLMKPKTPASLAQPATQPRLFPQTPVWIGFSIMGWLLAVMVVTEVWYRSHEKNLIPNLEWAVAWPVNNPQFIKTVVPANSLAILRCSDSAAGSWQDETGNHWSAFVLRWNPGKNSEQLAKGHRPEICFPAAGAKLVDDFGPVTLDANGVVIPFHHQSFAIGAKLIHVFYCLWSDRILPHGDAAMETGPYANRLSAVMTGKRNVGQKVLEIVVQGPDSGDDAVTTLKQQLPNLIRRQ
jgi:exosortase